MVVEFIDQDEPEQPEEPRFVNDRPPQTPFAQMYPAANYKEVIQEYTKEDNVISEVKDKFWGMNSKSLVLGFNNKDDALDYQDLQEMSRIWDIMKDPEEYFTWDRGQDYHQITFLLKARVNRSILQPNGGINERIAQNTQINQNISTNTVKQGQLGGSGFLNNARDKVSKFLG